MNGFQTEQTINNYIDDVIIITLPERKIYIKNVMDKMGIYFKTFNAITGNTLNTDTLIKKGILDKNHIFKNNNEIACSLSHLTVISNFLSSGKNSMCVFEDDIQFNPDHYTQIKKVMEEIPVDYEYINLSRCWAHCHSQVNVSESVAITKHSMCSSAYIITRQGANKIIKNAYPIKYPVDIYFSNLMENPINLQFYSSNPRIFTQSRTTMSSSLNNNDLCIECDYITDPYDINIIVIIIILLIVSFAYFYFLSK